MLGATKHYGRCITDSVRSQGYQPLLCVEKNMNRTKRTIPASILFITLLLTMCTATTAQAAPQPLCAEMEDVYVSLADGDSRTTKLSVEYCSKKHARGTVAVLVHGASYDRRYNEDLARYLAKRKIAALNVSLVGAGMSDYPADASGITIQTQGWVIRDLVAQLRAGDLFSHGKNILPNKVVLVGHSMGAMAATIADTIAPSDIDGLVLHGYSHTLGSRAIDSFSLAYPANSEPQFSQLSFDYATTLPVFPEPFPQAGQSGVREYLFFHPPGTDTTTIAMDEANKQPYTFAMLGSIGDALGASFGVTAPTLVVVGDHDAIVCAAPDCVTSSSLVDEHLTFPNAESFDYMVVENTGHSISLHENAKIAYKETAHWIRSVVGDPNCSNLETTLSPIQNFHLFSNNCRLCCGTVLDCAP
jgi:pimeloyl-ACP methyl ester carboxylesterase